MDLILATRNAHKVQEIARMLAPFGLNVLPLPEQVWLPPETGESFEENALPKAMAAAAQLGVAAISDDSGIEAQALGGRPGVYSARYAGADATDAENLAKLLSEAPPGSGLRYVCVLAFIDPRLGLQQTFEGECRGTLAAEPAGDGGFGYDPAFIPDEYPGDLTMAQITPEQKDAISHRGRAVKAFGQWFADNLAQRRS